MRRAGALPALVAGLAACLAGCAVFAPPPAPPTAPVAGVTIDRAGAGRAEVDHADSSRTPVESRPAPQRAAPAAATVAILFSGAVPAQAAIAAATSDGLAGPAYTVRQIDIDALGPGGSDSEPVVAPIDAAFEAGVDIVAAVGPGALDVAQQRFTGAEIVFSQVLEPSVPPGDARRIRGTAPMPPPALQLAAWAEVDPGLERIGLITSERFAGGLAGVQEASAAIGAELVHLVSTSDRETLYLFRRLAPSIDGLWLAPDSGILSTAVIDEMLALAAELEIGVLVFSEALLDRGGLLSVSAPEAHVAATVVAAIEAIRAGRAAALPAAIPLSEASVRVNARIAAELGLPDTPTEWVIGDGS